MKTVEYLADLFQRGRARPSEREGLLQAFDAQLKGPTFNPAAISSKGKALVARLEKRAQESSPSAS